MARTDEDAPRVPARSTVVDHGFAGERSSIGSKRLPPGFITTVAGVGPYQQQFARATEADIRPGGIAYDGGGKLFIAEPSHNRVSRVDTAGNFSNYAGNGSIHDSLHSTGDGGLGLDARINFPTGIAADVRGNLFIADKDGQLLRRVDAASGVITSIAGDGNAGFSGDGGPAALARLKLPNAVAVDIDGVIFFMDSGNMRMRRITSDGIIRTIAGTGERGFSGDGGLATEAKLDLQNSDIGSVVIDRHGNIFFCDEENKRVRKIDMTTGIITTAAGPNDDRGKPIHDLLKVFVGPDDSLYYAIGSIIVKIDPSGKATRWGGAVPTGPPAEGVLAATAALGFVGGLVLSAAGDIVYSDGFFSRVRRIDAATGLLYTVAGIGPRIPRNRPCHRGRVFNGGRGRGADGLSPIRRPTSFTNAVGPCRRRAARH